MGTMASSTHQFGVLDLIRAGLQDLDTARTLLDELRATASTTTGYAC